MSQETVNETVTQPKRPRGRPRPQEAIERDRTVLALLQDKGPMTRNQLCELTGVEQTKMYLCLDRLRKQGLTKLCQPPQPEPTGDGKRTPVLRPDRIWTVATDQPCP